MPRARRSPDSRGRLRWCEGSARSISPGTPSTSGIASGAIRCGRPGTSPTRHNPGSRGNRRGGCSGSIGRKPWCRRSWRSGGSGVPGGDAGWIAWRAEPGNGRFRRRAQPIGARHAPKPLPLRGEHDVRGLGVPSQGDATPRPLIEDTAVATMPERPACQFRYGPCAVSSGAGPVAGDGGGRRRYERGAGIPGHCENGGRRAQARAQESVKMGTDR